MPRTTVGVFKDQSTVDGVIREIEALGFPRQEIRTIDEPATFPVTGLMSFDRLDFEVDLMRELTRIGATRMEAKAYVQELRRGGTLVLATGSDDKVDRAAEIMNRRGAIEIEETSGPEPQIPHIAHESAFRMPNAAVMTGRIRQAGGRSEEHTP